MNRYLEYKQMIMYKDDVFPEPSGGTRPSPPASWCLCSVAPSHTHNCCLKDTNRENLVTFYKKQQFLLNLHKFVGFETATLLTRIQLYPAKVAWKDREELLMS
jgi:hypothetical protein